jgi:hypothetical protein
MYEVWFTRIKDHVVLFSLVFRSTSQYKRKQDNTILYPCESYFIRGLLNTSENKTTRSVIHVNHHMDKGSYCLVFACIERSTYEVWFTWIKDHVVLFSLVFRSPCMKCDSHGKTRQHDPLSMWIILHTWTSQYKRKQDNTILYPCESHFIHGLLNTSENKTIRSFIRVVLFSLVLRSPRMKCDSHG